MLEVDVRVVDVGKLVVVLLLSYHLQLLCATGLNFVVVVHKRRRLGVGRFGDEPFLGLLFLAGPRAQLVGLRVLDVALPRGLLL